ncbi:MAG: hypothetical protein O8C64_13670 [Candidatus Methanoperedens sp.]|nr:hypothetical protein [Candidatus Methanoperedens sp.]MCZ7403775.1 hypothetical protein [Candidatus Methanoperedens sp.]
MNPRLFLKMAFPAILILSFITLVLPRNVAGIYTVDMMLVSLFIAFLLSLKVAFSYERELRMVFLYIAPFILLLFLVNVGQFWTIVYDLFGQFPFISLIIAGIAYVFLIMSCINVLKITDFAEFHKKEWAAIFLMCILSNYIIILYLLNYHLEYNAEGLTKILFRIIDNAIVLMLLPILFLYRKHSLREKRESVTFTIVIIGIIISTIGDYVYEILARISHQELSEGFHTGTLLDSIYIFSYLLIAIGLFVHLNYYKWTMGRIDLSKLDFKFN